jgi:hypothetical protein
MLRFFKDVAKAIIKRQRAFKTIEEVYILEKKGRKEEALNLCEELVRQIPNNAQFRFRLATLQESLGRPILLPNSDDSIRGNLQRPAR